MRYVGCAIALLLLVFQGIAAAQAAPRIALVVGNAKYRNLPALANPGNDAVLMATTLRRLGFEVIERTDADYRAMARAVLDFSKRVRASGPQTVGLFYYAGHGVQSQGGNYLIPVGAPIESQAELEIEAISAAWVLRQMEDAGNSLNIVVLDACRNNPYRGSFRSASRGLSRMDAPKGSLIAYSAGPGEAAADGSGANSPYTSALVKAMESPGLKVEEVFKKVRISVERATGGDQTPWEESSLKGDFYFVPGASAATGQGTGSGSSGSGRETEIVFWESIKDSDNGEMFEAYLTSYPNGAFVPLARAKLAELKRRQAALTPQVPPTEPASGIEEMEGLYRAVSRSNVRAGPATRYPKVATMAPGEQVTVTGKVRGQNWFRIALASGGEGFVFGQLLQDEAAYQADQRRKQQEARRPSGDGSGGQAVSIAGLWAGSVTYNSRQYTPFNFQADVRLSGSRISGRTSEPNTFAPEPVSHLYANLSGQVRPNGELHIVKTYDGTGKQTHSVDYYGRLVSPNRIEGTWQAGTIRGTFVMTRSE